MRAVATVSELWRYPVKSMGGERVDALAVDARGAAGDRTHAVWWTPRLNAAERPLTAREAGRLLRWDARYDPALEVGLDAPPLPTLRAPNGVEHDWDSAGLAQRLGEDLARGPVTLRRDVSGQQDLERSLLVTTGASLRALEAELGVEVDGRRFRTNLHLELDGAEPWSELEFEGGRISFDGGVELAVLHPCVRCVIPTRTVDSDTGEIERWPALLTHLNRVHARCFGINTRVVRPGRIAAGERARIASS